MEVYKILTEFSNYEVSTFSNVRNRITRKILKQRLRPDGYKDLVLKDNRGVRRCPLIHQLVAYTFIGKPTGNLQVDHIDRNKWNNNIQNLRFLSPSDNCMNRTVKNKFNVNGICKRATKYHVRIKNIHLGMFLTLEEAIMERFKYENILFPHLFNNNLTSF